MLARIEPCAARDLAVGRPSIYVTEADYERLSVLVRAAAEGPTRRRAVAGRSCRAAVESKPETTTSRPLS